MSDRPLELYNLLPALYRLRDAERGYPLRAFVDVISEQIDIVKKDIDGLWDDFFIETCADWVIPYIGDLIANNHLYDVGQPLRADVAKTIYYRRRKGTLPMLEELARDVTGWDTHAVAFFEHLAWTQHMSHHRLQEAANLEEENPPAVDRVGTVNLRSMDVLDRVAGPFDQLSHSVDVRPIAHASGWHNIRKIGFFLWRLKSYHVDAQTPRSSTVAATGFHFNALNHRAPLFNHAKRETQGFALATEIHVPGPIRPRAFFERPGDYYGHGNSIAIYRGSRADEAQLISVNDVLCKDLTSWDLPPSGRVAIDLLLGRIAFAPGEVPAEGLTVAYNYGFSAHMGGGPYDRRRVLANEAKFEWLKTVAEHDPAADFTTLAAALSAWADPTDGNRANGVITILDNGYYTDPVDIEPGDTSALVIQAADGFRPNISASIVVTGNHPEAALTLNGLLIEGYVDLQGALGSLSLTHCTVVPGRELDEAGNPPSPVQPSLQVAAGNPQLELRIDASIVGPLQVPDEVVALLVHDSIVDAVDGTAIEASGGTFGPPTTLVRTTVHGEVNVKELTLASEVIFDGAVTAQRQQNGCVRFSYVPYPAQTPRRYRCQPDLALLALAKSLGKGTIGDLTPTEMAPVLARIRPGFTSRQYKDPAYMQLSHCCAEEIRVGAQDGSEMGAFSQLKQPQRETNLRIRLEEYLPFGLEAGMIYVT